MYGWLQVLYIFFFAPYCSLGNIILAGFFFFFWTLDFLFFFLDIFAITWWLCANGLRECHQLNPHNKLLMAEKKWHNNSWSNNYRCGKLLCMERWMLELVFGNNKNSTWMLFPLDLILFLLITIWDTTQPVCTLLRWIHEPCPTVRFQLLFWDVTTLWKKPS